MKGGIRDGGNLKLSS